MVTITASYVLALMLHVRAHAKESATPWEDTLPETALAIANACNEAPLPGGGPEDCAASTVIFAWSESRYNPHAVHDHGWGHGLYGTHDDTLGFAVPPDPRGQTFAFLELLRGSVEVCSANAPDERFAEYASGSCEKRKGLSRHRALWARRLLRDHPFEQRDR